MIIDHNLRTAIKAAERAQTQDNNYEDRQRANTKACKDLISLKKLQRKEAAARLKYKRAEQLRKEADAFFAALGIKPTFSSGIQDEERFVKLGGVLPKLYRRWKADNVIAELAAASPKDGAKILAKYGINWT